MLYDGGPCAGQRQHFDSSVIAGDTIRCGGAVYDLSGGVAGFYHATYREQGGFSDANPTGIPDAGTRSAWRRFLHVVGREVPDQINASKRARIRLRAAGKR